MFDNLNFYFFIFQYKGKPYKVYTLSNPMHLYTLTRGIKSRMNEWENDLGAQWMPLKYKMPDGKITKGRIKLAIREVKLHEIIFPKEYEEAVMGLINPAVGKSKQIGKWGQIIPKLARFLGLKKPLQEWKKNDTIYSDGIACLALGTKEDVMNFDLTEPVQKHGVIPQENL